MSKWYLETNNLKTTQQAGFRQFCSTEDQATHLSKGKEDAFKEQKVVVNACVDLQRVFEKVWTDWLLVKMMRRGVVCLVLQWLKLYLHNRGARVSLLQKSSKKF